MLALLVPLLLSPVLRAALLAQLEHTLLSMALQLVLHVLQVPSMLILNK